MISSRRSSLNRSCRWRRGLLATVLVAGAAAFAGAAAEAQETVIIGGSGRPPVEVNLDVIEEYGRALSPQRRLLIPGQPLPPLAGTLVLHPPLPREQTPLLSLVAGLAVGNCLARELALRPLLKWPNDVFLGARKVCGILLEMKMQGGAPRVVMGIGLNCNGAPKDFPPDLRESLTTLAHETGRAVDMQALFAALLAGQQEAYDRLLAGQQTALLEEWCAMAALEGRALIYPTPEGPRPGKALGLTDEGHLLIETAAGATHVHHSGELEWTG